MIIFELGCAHGHRFEGWFASGEEFSRQQERGLVNCPVCDDAHVERLPSARVSVAKGSARDNAPPAEPTEERPPVADAPVGLPLEAAGKEGPQAATTRAWVEALAAALDRPVAIAFQDERLTSHVAETRLGPMPRGRSGGPPTKRQRDTYRAKVDREAAAIILQDWLDTRREPDASSPPTPPSRSTPTTLETTR